MQYIIQCSTHEGATKLEGQIEWDYIRWLHRLRLVVTNQSVTKTFFGSFYY